MDLTLAISKEFSLHTNEFLLHVLYNLIPPGPTNHDRIVCYLDFLHFSPFLVTSEQN